MNEKTLEFHNLIRTVATQHYLAASVSLEAAVSLPAPHKQSAAYCLFNCAWACLLQLLLMVLLVVFFFLISWSSVM
jgi:hypothetical protein